MTTKKNYSKFFAHKLRRVEEPTPEKFIALTDDASDALKDLIYDIHGHFDEYLPCDWLYKAIFEAVNFSEENPDLEEGFGDSGADLYTQDLCIWAQNRCAQNAIDEILEEEDTRYTFYDLLQRAQYRVLNDVHAMVLAFVNSQQGKENEKNL